MKVRNEFGSGFNLIQFYQFDILEFIHANLPVNQYHQSYGPISKPFLTFSKIIKGLRRDLNPPRAVSSKIMMIAYLVLTTAAYTHQAILRRPTNNSKTTANIFVRRDHKLLVNEHGRWWTIFLSCCKYSN